MPVIEKTSSEKHDGDAICVAFFGNQVFSGGIDGKIKIWDSDLNLIKTLDAHESYICALAINSKGKLYSSSCDGCVKYMQMPYDKIEMLFRCDDIVQAMYCEGDILYTGDDKGIVCNWENDKMLFKYSLVEEVKSLAAEQDLIYTVRDLDVVVSRVVSGKSGKYSTKAVMPGKSPLCLLGALGPEKRHKYLVFADRSGMGMILANNTPGEKFNIIWNAPDCHEMIINGICSDDTYIYSGGYDKKVKGWSHLDEKEPKCLGEVDVGSCVNSICCGNNNTVYIGSSDGVIRCAKFI